MGGMNRRLTGLGLLMAGLSVAAGGVRATPRFERSALLQRGARPGAWAIPKLTVTPRGTLLVVLQDRKGGDWGKPIFPMLLRSLDGGRSWRGPRELLRADFPRRDDCIFKPTGIVTDRETGRVFVFVSRAPLRQANGQPLLERDFYRHLQETRRLGRAWFLLSSDDDGVSWSEPREITAQLIKRRHWQEWSPVHSGLQMRHGAHAGRLVVPVRCHCPPTDPSPKFDTKWQTNGVLFSDDHGKTWTPGGATGPHVGEASLAELADGTLLLQQRASPGQPPRRWIATSRDGGVSFGPSRPTGQRDAPCHAGLLALPDGTLVMSHVPGPGRQRLTLSTSRDGGRSWQARRIVEPGAAAYSDLGRLPDGGLVCVYETGKTTSRKDLAVARFNEEWLFAGDGDPAAAADSGAE